MVACAPGRAEPAVDQAERILVVEDDAELRSLLGELLRTEGFQAVSVADGAEAIRRATSDRPDAVILDLMLPDMSGFEVCQELKFRRDTNLIPIVMLTALHDARSRRSGLRVGANRYLTKPFSPDELLREVRSSLEHRRELSERRTHTSVELQLDSDTHQREQLNDLLSELFVQTPLSETEIGQIRTATLEMIENAAEWGNRRHKDLTVSIAYEVTDRWLKFVITDQGPGFDRGQLPHAAQAEDPTAHMEIREKLGLRNGGFGILIARGMVDHFEYNERGNQVTLVKYFVRSANS